MEVEENHSCRRSWVGNDTTTCSNQAAKVGHRSQYQDNNDKDGEGKGGGAAAAESCIMPWHRDVRLLPKLLPLGSAPPAMDVPVSIFVPCLRTSPTSSRLGCGTALEAPVFMLLAPRPRAPSSPPFLSPFPPLSLSLCRTQRAPEAPDPHLPHALSRHLSSLPFPLSLSLSAGPSKILKLPIPISLTPSLATFSLSLLHSSSYPPLWRVVPGE